MMDDSSFDEMSLYDLFRMDARDQVDLLADKLLLLLDGGAAGDGGVLQALMRGAHSFKGAARIVGLDDAVRLTHALESRFVAAMEGTAIGKDEVSMLLGAVDLLRGILNQDESSAAAWLQGQGAAIDRFVVALDAGATGGKIELPSAGKAAVEPETPARSVLTTAWETGGADTDAGSVSESSVSAGSASAGRSVLEAASVPEASAEEHAGEEHAGEERAAAEQGIGADTAFRISTQRFNRILSLAADSVVQAQGMIRLHESMQGMSRRMATSLRRIEGMARDRVANAPEDRGRLQPISAALREIGEAQAVLRAALTDMDAEVYVQERKARGLHHEVLQARLRPLSDLLPTLRRLVHEVARELGKPVQFTVTGERTEVDRDILEQLRAPLEHLLRNAIDHGLESAGERLAAGKPATGTIELRARHEYGRLLLTIEDDGSGIDAEAIRDSAVRKGLVQAGVAAELSQREMLEFLFLPGFTTRLTVTEISGRGFGLDVVQSMVHEAGGAVRVQSSPGEGASFDVTLPVTRSILRILRVEADDEVYAVPMARIARVATGAPERDGDGLWTVEGARGNRVPVVRLTEALGGGGPTDAGVRLLLFLLDDRGEEAAIAFSVGQLLGDSLVAVRPLDERLGKLPAVAAVTLTEANVPMLILEPGEVLRAGLAAVSRQAAEPDDPALRASVLVVDDSHTVRQMLRRTLLGAQYRVSIAQHGAEAWSMLQLQPFDLLVSDVDMPEMNGIELVEHVRADARLEHLPILLLSYKARDDDRRRGLEAGADAYVTKGEFAEEAFLQVVTDLIGTSDPLPVSPPNPVPDPLAGSRTDLPPVVDPAC